MDDFVRYCKLNLNKKYHLGQIIVQDLRLIRIVECKGFRSILNYLEVIIFIMKLKNICQYVPVEKKIHLHSVPGGEKIFVS